MSASESRYTIETTEALELLYGPVAETSVRKEIDHIHPHYQTLIEASPFAIIATNGPNGLDVSPRGDAPGFVKVEDEHTLLLPERRGNNRIDSLRNLIGDPRVSLLFMIPGVGETLRVRGRASISIDPLLLERFAVQGQQPKCVLVIRVERAFFQCARAIRRSRLWDPQSWADTSSLPTPGKILGALTDGAIDGQQYDIELPERQKKTLY